MNRVYQLSSMVQFAWFGTVGSITCWFSAFACFHGMLTAIHIYQMTFSDVCIVLTLGNIHEQLTVTPFINSFMVSYDQSMRHAVGPCDP